MPNDEYRCAKFHSKFPLTLSTKQHDSSRVKGPIRSFGRLNQLISSLYAQTSSETGRSSRTNL